MMFGKLVLVFSALGVLTVSAQLLQSGQCNDAITLQINFLPEQFAGTWYEIGRATAEGGDCSSWEITSETNAYNFTYNVVDRNFVVGTTAQATLETGTARYTLNYGGSTNEDFWILGTNYQEYAVGYRCENVGTDQRNIYLWLLGRSTTINSIFTNVLNNLVSQFGITIADLSDVDHSENACFTLPVYASNEAVILPGQCDPNISLLSNFDAGRFLGTWNEIYSYYSENALGTCSRAQYSAGDDGVIVENSQVVNQALFTINGVAVVADAEAAQLSVTLEVIPGVFAVQDLWIIDTDYDNYAISYSCNNIGNDTKRVFSWIVSRERTLSAASEEAVNRVVDSILDLNFEYYNLEDQSDEGCFYYPPFSADTVVEFPGQCDLSIPAVPNFDAVRYMGLWHDIASYPSGFQEGTCNNALYTLNEVVDVYNTQVIDQQLDFINGTAVPVSTDGSAQLEVTFPIAGTNFTIQTPYWVLATDYDSYSLVYTCIYNNAADTRIVYSWKLSRSKTLSAEADQTINSVIANIPVLDDRYYITRDQSPEGCFYFPEPQQGVPVVFPGQCDETIAAVPNFDLTQFQGTWYEIETYPKEQSGECVRHEYAQGASNNLNISSSFLLDSFPGSSSSVLEFASADDASGKFTIVVNTGDVEVEMPFWILSVDYDDYALAYSCMNRGNDYRAVYSWKLSRNRSQLSTSAQTQITNVINSIDVLDERYFETIEQDEIECIPLPEIAEGEPIILEGQCNQNIPVVQNFEPGRYVGLWHLIESYPSAFQNGTCNDATYTAQADGSVLVFNTQVVNQQLDSITGLATVASTDGSARLLVTFPDAPFPVEYWVVDTDYDSYSLVYSCVDLSDNRQQIWSWKMSRTKSLTEEAVENIERSIDSIRVLNNRYYYTIDNSDEACFYYPEPNGNPVIFRGQCNETIPVVTNFDAVAYMGLWYDIESYPQPFQDGSCATATYSLVDGGVDVFNTQVVNQTLDTILGRAFLVDTPNTEAKLDVFFPIAGVGDVFSPYWVLATDYTDYALVYACQNFGSDTRSVASWKLSRQRTLSTQAQQNINAIIASIDVLQQDYFEVKGHTDDQCFYYPEPTGEPVVFRGQCDDSIQAMPNFDLGRFAGSWNEIQTYPKEQVGGQCINHEFTVDATSNTVLQLTSNQVFNSDTLVSNDGQIVLSSTDGSGRFTLTINTTNGLITMPYWIIDTDYTDYALVYSCMVRDTQDTTIGTRAVYSWKLSRSRQLSDAANVAINTAMESIDVLQQQYFENVTQTDAACFYLPDLGLNEPVILPGQCDPNIAVVQNFSAGDYVGLWHLVETYYSEFQDGDCNDATYTAQADGSVLVFNTQVIDQRLDTITGVATVATTDGSAILSVVFPDVPVPLDYLVLDTDYENFSLVYSCRNVTDTTQQVWSWKLSRTRALTNESVIRINERIAEVPVLSNRYFNVVNNTDDACFYYPEPNGNPVVFRGQCDESIPVVTNFDAVAYMGLWYDIESYPQPFQDGSCATATYSLVDGGVDVFNTQVVNQTLDTILGRAFLVDTPDTEAKLDVFFPIAGVGDVFSPYWVLATDYTDYALVYACQNFGPDTRSVASWKLSRQRTLSTQAQQSINAIIASIDVLQQDYFEVKGHTDDQCFYYPEPTGEPVVFRGQCDDSIQAMPNFDLGRFAGVWNEIQTYPKEQVGGQCISHELTASATSSTTLQLISNQVFNSETLVSNDGQIVLSSTDGSGRFTLTINTANGTITMPYWILDTDYTDYALVYSCMPRVTEDMTIESRAVYSWKLSRSQQLSNAANTAINSVMASIDVLQQQYFEDVSQTDTDCFYLPEIGQNEPVIFTGQCDPNIPVMTNFEASRFVGRWFDIESYFDDYTGTCIDGNFTSTASGYDIRFTQVVNQGLIETLSTATLAVDNSGILTVTANGVTFEYWILDTDYENWALLYSCDNVGTTQRRVRSWKMSRTRALTTEANTAINAIINNTDVLNERFYNTRDHSDAACFYFPEPNGNPVTFRGRCDLSIPVVENFSVQDYLGQWYDIQSYPQAFQDGECASALYTLGANGVDVYNTQVVNQQLDSIIGLAVPASNDDRAILNVTFIIDGFELVTPYWVLSTDYTSYSLVYSCSEIDDEYKRVSAWKLSRTRTLAQTAEQTINQVMSTIPVLDQQYFRDIGHSDEDCFFYPDNNGGPVILDGQCSSASEVQAITNFNVNAFEGTWHEVSRFPSELQEGECTSAQITVQSASQLAIIENIVNDERLTISSNTGTVSTDGRGVISTEGLDLFILDTDYSEFALVYACQDRGNSSKQIYSWILSRSRAGLSQASTDRINAIVSDNEDLFELYYEPTQQTNDACFYYPEFDELPSFIELPGPCSTQNITGMANFDAAGYLGRWFEIARYPQPDQFGMCAQATYSLGDGVVDVYNTQVVDRTLLIQEGYAVVASTDGTGELLVTFDVNGIIVNANYIIVDSDYSSYSLVYSCRDLVNGNSQVYSWILSRDRTLSNAASQAINDTIANSRGLLEDYYAPTSQTDEDCFYVPEPNPDQQVAFRGQCGTITGMQNFDAQRYLGLWHEVERYPTGENDGECISSNFQPTGNTIEVTDTSVFGDSANISTQTVTISSDGRITRGNADVWVLDTDYDTYAILFSCQNIDDEYRRVWSAKHSRSRTLPETAETAIAQVLQNNDLLYQDFYVEVDQSDDACFYYPEVTGQPVVLPGQCDDNIPVMTNFALVEYTGTWYQIERYPQFHESGNCTGARYTLDEELGIVTVLNWEVIDGELDTIEGTATPVSDDGTARFRVVLPSRVVEGEDVEMNLYVLTTDYTTYALAYSCENVGTFQRQLGVWKLSRTRSMPAAGTTAINAYMTQRQELDQRYFVSVEQSEECEEPNSSYLVKSSIIVLLLCSILQKLL